MSWMETGSIEETQGNGDVDRPRGIAALVFLGELLFVYWLSASMLLSVPGSSGSGQSAVHAVSVTPLLLWPVQPPEEVSSEVFPANPEAVTEENDSLGKAQSGSFSSLESGDTLGLDGADSPDDIRIVSISPSPATALWTGDIVNFEVNVEYNVTSSDSKSLTLLIQEIGGCSCEGVNPVLMNSVRREQPELVFRVNTSMVVQKGRRRLTLTKRIRVPVAGGLDVMARLAGNDAGSESTDGRAYLVKDAGKPATGHQSTVRVASMEPNEESVIRAGDSVDFEVVVDYNLVSELGTLNLQIGIGDASPFAEFAENVKKGQRRIVFRERIQVPPDGSGTVQVKAQLVETGSTNAAVHSSSDSKKYQLSP
jgi:hypothetical protein